MSEYITVIGSGGKTSLIWHLAVSFCRAASSSRMTKRRVLVSPTTKMLVPRPEENLYDLYYNFREDEIPAESGWFKPQPGITLAGCFNKNSGKLEPLPMETLEKAVSGYDLVLMEGDGAKELPLKAWAAHEPVVPPFTTLTIGVLPLWPLGKPISEKLIHRLPLFLELTNAVVGEPVKPEHFIALITGSKTSPGLFAKSHGKKLLFLNCMEEEAVNQARKITNLLPDHIRNSISGIITGNALDVYKVIDL